ncbi:MAG: hypothetical protein LBS88_10395 [Tannerellaceae bacterium]|jgi:tetratricopeptide (TPR) repeat protein|nr:hypothetical protein [Tannerellaceae bacterium]
MRYLSAGKGFLLILLLFACTHKRETEPVLSEAKELLESRPDSAWVVLNGMNVEAMDAYNRACHALLLAEATDRNELPLVDCDSLLNQALEYLDDKRDKHLKAEALLYKGRICLKMNECPHAVQYYLKAQNLLEGEAAEWQTLSIIYDDLGQVYAKENLPKKALEMFWKGYHLDRSAADYRGLTLSLRNIGRTYFSMQYPDSAFFYLQKAFDYAGQTTDSIHFRDLICNDLAKCYYKTGEYASSLRFLNSIVKTSDKIHLYKGLVWYKLGQTDSAAYYFHQSAGANDVHIRIKSAYYLNQIEKECGNDEKAYAYSKKYDTLMDSIQERTRAMELQLVYHKRHKQADTTQETNDTTLKIILCIPIAWLIMTAAYFFTRDKKRSIKQKIQERKLLNFQRQTEESKRLISELENRHIVNEKEIIKRKNELDLLYGYLNDLQCKMFRNTISYKRITSLLKQNASSKVMTIDDRRVLYNEVKTVFAGFISKLSASCPVLTEDEIIHCCLSQFGFDSKAISLCFGYTNTDSTRNRKSRIKKKMINECTCENIYHSVFSDKNQ